MQVSLSASGTPAQVANSIASQAKAAGRGNPAAWPAIASLRDYVLSAVRKAPEDGSVSVSGSVSITISVSAPAQSSHEEISATASEPPATTKK